MPILEGEKPVWRCHCALIRMSFRGENDLFWHFSSEKHDFPSENRSKSLKNRFFDAFFFGQIEIRRYTVAIGETNSQLIWPKRRIHGKKEGD